MLAAAVAEAPGLIDILTDAADSATRPLLHWFGSHPKILATVLFAVLVDNALRATWPDYATRPKWVRFVTGFIAPLVGNFWLALVFVAKKFHLQLRRPKDDDGLTIGDTEQVEPQTKEGIPTGKPIESLAAPEKPKD